MGNNNCCYKNSDESFDEDMESLAPNGRRQNNSKKDKQLNFDLSSQRVIKNQKKKQSSESERGRNHKN